MKTTIDSMIETLLQWRETLPGDTPIAQVLDDEGEMAELIGDIGPGFFVDDFEIGGHGMGRIVCDDDVDGKTDALRVLVLWPRVQKATP